MNIIRRKDGLKLEAKDIIRAVQTEIQTGDINNILLDRCPGLSPEMSRVLVAGIIAKAVTFGFTIPSVIEEYVEAWRESNGS